VRRWQVESSLIYGQVKKCYRRRKLMQVTHVMRLGTEAALQAALQGLGFSGRLNTAFISDCSTGGRSSGTPNIGYSTAVSTSLGPSGVVASLLSFCTSPCIAASSTCAATRTRRQPFGSTLPAAYASHGSRKNDPTVDRARSAVLSLTKCARLETGSANALREASRNGSGRPTRGNNLPEPSKAGKMSSKYVHPLSVLACY